MFADCAWVAIQSNQAWLPPLRRRVDRRYWRRIPINREADAPARMPIWCRRAATCLKHAARSGVLEHAATGCPRAIRSTRGGGNRWAATIVQVALANWQRSQCEAARKRTSSRGSSRLQRACSWAALDTSHQSTFDLACHVTPWPWAMAAL